MASSHTFVLVETSVGETSAFRAVPQLVKILNAAQCYELAEKASSSGTKAAEFMAFDNALKSTLKKYFGQGVDMSAEDVFGTRIGVKGGFATASGPWVVGVNMLQPAIFSKGALKVYPMQHLDVCWPENSEEGTNPLINNVFDPTTSLYDILTGINSFTVTGKNLVPDASKDDEGVWIRIGANEYKCTVTDSQNTVVKATPPTISVATGTHDAVLVIRTRSGAESTAGVAEVTRIISYVKA